MTMGGTGRDGFPCSLSHLVHFTHGKALPSSVYPVLVLLFLLRFDRFRILFSSIISNLQGHDDDKEKSPMAGTLKRNVTQGLSLSDSQLHLS